MDRKTSLRFVASSHFLFVQQIELEVYRAFSLILSSFNNMPPKKKSTTSTTTKKKNPAAKLAGAKKTVVTDEKVYVWQLTYELRRSSWGMEEVESNHVLFSSKEKAIAAMPAFMDKHSDSEWRSGLKGFGREEEDNYLSFEYSGDSVGDNGELLSNGDSDSNETESIYLSQMEVDPPVTRY